MTSPALAQTADTNPAFIARDLPGAEFSRALAAATRENPVRAYNIATVSDPHNPARFSEQNRMMVIDTAIKSLQAYLDRNAANPDNQIELAHIETLNALSEFHNDALRFETITKLNANGVYQLITKGRAELFTSTFNHLYTSFMDRLGKENAGFSAFLKRRPENMEGLPAFIDAVSVFGQFDDFNRRISAGEKENIIGMMISGMAEHPSYAPTAANFIRHLDRNDPAVAKFESSMVQAYDQASDLREKDTLGILGNWYINQYGASPRPELSASLSLVAQNLRYTLDGFDTVAASNLFDAKGRHFQMHLFYNDDDGVENFNSFSSSLRADGWNVSRMSSRTDIAIFTKSSGGKSISIYATVPSLSGAGTASVAARAALIKEDIAARGGHVSMLVHRGHSYTANTTIRFADKDTDIVFLGACGGTQFIQRTLERNPGAHIIASANIGYRTVNNDMLRTINRQIATGKDIEWQKIAPPKDYILPPQNVTAMFMAKYFRLRDGQIQHPAPSAGIAPHPMP